MADNKQESDPSQDDYRRAFLRAKRALEHLMHKNHELKPSSCAGCLEVSLFLTEPGYMGDDKNPVGVDY